MRTPPSHINGGSHYEFISGTHHSYEKMEYAFMVLREYHMKTKIYSLIRESSCLSSVLFLQIFHIMHEAATFHPLFQYEFSFLLQH